MSKVIKLYAGENSQGNSVELAQSENGKWFFRIREYNGYAVAWSKWLEYTDDLIYRKTITNSYDDSVYEIPECEQHETIQWGFRYLKMVYSYGKKYRLPN
jgi:hypothetical protein